MKLDILDEFTDELIAFRFQPAVDMVDLNKKPVTRDVSRWYMRYFIRYLFYYVYQKYFSDRSRRIPNDEWKNPKDFPSEFICV